MCTTLGGLFNPAALACRHYARCGPLLGHMLQGSDDQVLLQDLFLRCRVDDASTMCWPPMSSVHPDTGDEESVEPTTLTLRSDCIVSMDCFSHLLVWVGAEVAAERALAWASPACHRDPHRCNCVCFWCLHLVCVYVCLCMCVCVRRSMCVLCA